MATTSGKLLNYSACLKVVQPRRESIFSSPCSPHGKNIQICSLLGVVMLWLQGAQARILGFDCTYSSGSDAYSGQLNSDVLTSCSDNNGSRDWDFSDASVESVFEVHASPRQHFEETQELHYPPAFTIQKMHMEVLLLAQLSLGSVPDHDFQVSVNSAKWEGSFSTGPFAAISPTTWDLDNSDLPFNY